MKINGASWPFSAAVVHFERIIKFAVVGELSSTVGTQEHLVTLIH